MIQELSKRELNERIKLNFEKLANDSYYQIENIFKSSEYDWPGDAEGRALLAFVSHYKISGEKIPCMEYIIKELPERLKENGVLGAKPKKIIFEQQLSGHSWLLRGLCEYYELFLNKEILELIKGIVKRLYLPTKGRYGTYPINRVEKTDGGVSGNSADTLNGWLLSTDIGCAFMSIDGLSHAYKIIKDKEILALLDEMIEVYSKIDKVALKAQTHCTLSAARGMIRLYYATNNVKYLNNAIKIYNLYVFGGGMTFTYQNYNWWGREDSWTEPCAIVDSMMLALELYKITGDNEMRAIAARIFHNGLATAQRQNGGAGTDSPVSDKSPFKYLKTFMYEAVFCCSMRLAEGLWYANENRALLYAELDGRVTKQTNGTYTDGDIIYALVTGGAENYAEKFSVVDGLRLCPIVKYYRVPKEITENSKQQIIF